MRAVTVLHLFWKSVSRGTERFLLRPHAAWSADGRALLAPLTKKVPADAADGDAALRRTLDALHREDVSDAPPLARLRWLPPAALRLRSPARGVETHYRIVPATAHCPARRCAAHAARLGGTWLTRAEALQEPSLSPTARRALDAVRSTPAGPLSPDALAGDWTQRLLHARDHDQRAFGPLFEDMRPLLRRLVRGLLRRPADVDDALSETSLQALAHLDAYEPVTAPATWLGAILRNVAVDLLRRQGKAVAAGPDAAEVADARPCPADAVEEAEQLARGRALLEAHKAAMTHVQRLAWRLRYEEGLEYAEIGAALEVPVGTLATWFHRVRAALQREARPC